MNVTLTPDQRPAVREARAALEATRALLTDREDELEEASAAADLARAEHDRIEREFFLQNASKRELDDAAKARADVEFKERRARALLEDAEERLAGAAANMNESLAHARRQFHQDIRVDYREHVRRLLEAVQVAADAEARCRELLDLAAAEFPARDAGLGIPRHGGIDSMITTLDVQLERLRRDLADGEYRDLLGEHDEFRRKAEWRAAQARKAQPTNSGGIMGRVLAWASGTGDGEAA